MFGAGAPKEKGDEDLVGEGLSLFPGKSLSASVVLLDKARRRQTDFMRDFVGLWPHSGCWAQSTKHSPGVGGLLIPPMAVLTPKS